MIGIKFARYPALDIRFSEYQANWISDRPMVLKSGRIPDIETSKAILYTQRKISYTFDSFSHILIYLEGARGACLVFRTDIICHICIVNITFIPSIMVLISDGNAEYVAHT